MALSTKNFALFFLLAFFSPLQIHARDIQFFNKVPTNNYNQEQDLSFTTTSKNGGSAFQISTTESVPYKDKSEVPFDKELSDNFQTKAQDLSNSKFYNTKQAFTSNDLYNANSKKNMFSSQRQGISDTRFMENGKYFYDINTEYSNRNAYRNSRINEYRFDKGNYGESYENNNAKDDLFQDIQDEEMP